MPRGRRPDPAEVKQAKGNPGKRPFAKPADDVQVISDAPPKWVKGTKIRNVWRQIAPDLRRLRFLKSPDEHALARYCDALVRWRKVTQQLDADPEGETYVTESAHGKMRRINPLFHVQSRLEKRLLDFEDRFGLNPAARQRIMQHMAQQPGLPLDPPPQPEVETPRASGPVGLLAQGSSAVN